METSPSRRHGTGSIDADQPHAHNLLDVLRQLDVNAGDRILGTTSGGKGWSGARLACKALRDFVDANIRSVELCWTWASATNVGARAGFTSPVARFRRCSCLSIKLGLDADGNAIRHLALLASLCVAGVGADMVRNITELHLEAPLELPSLVTVSVVLAGTLRHVRILALDTWPYGMGGFGFNNMHALHTALRGAFPALEELILPAQACLRGLEAFAGSRLHTVRVMAGIRGSLRMPHVRSLVQLPQLRELDLAGVGWDAQWRGGGHVWYDNEADSPAGAAELPLGDASDEETFREMEEEDVGELLALRLLLVSLPPALERLWWPGGPNLEVEFTGGRIACVDLHVGADGPDLHRAAATLLPVLAATGRRLPLLKVTHLADCPADIISLLQPHTPFSRLLAATDRVELGHLTLESGHQPSAEAAAAALQALVRAVGGMPEELHFGRRHCVLYLSLQTRSRYSAGAGGDRQAAGSAATAAAPAAVTEVTAQQVLERAVARMWDTAEVKAAATVAQVEAAIAAYEADGDDKRPRTTLDNMYVLLRGPLVWQRTCGPDGAASGGGAARLKEWLESLVARSPPPATAAAAATPGIPADTAASDSKAEASDLDAEASDLEAEDSDSDAVEVQRCSFAACGSGSVVAVACCDDSIAALQLYRAAAAAAASEAPGCLQVSACKADDFWLMTMVRQYWAPAIDEVDDLDLMHIVERYWAPPIREVIRELWDDHLRSTPVPAAPTAEVGQGLAALGARDAGKAVTRPVGMAAWEGDLQFIEHLLLLAEQAHEALDTVYSQ